MGVDQSRRYSANKVRRQDAHETSQDDQVRVEVLDAGKQLFCPSGSVLKIAGADDKTWDSVSVGMSQSVSVVVGTYGQNFDRVGWVLGGLKNCLEVRPTTTD